MTSDLLTKSCVPCEGGMAPMSAERAAAYMPAVPGWRFVEGEPSKITRRMKFKDFAQAMTFVNKVADVAESEGHHPDVCISWNKVTFELVTHAIGGLSENDFIIAAKINMLEGANQ
ncbi:MAG: 4a-hydroxytetrahydrobiopterin dehydratase [Dehalococcoidia bacterium]